MILNAPNNHDYTVFKYHKEYEKSIRLKSGASILVRSLTPCDSRSLSALFTGFSLETLGYRFLTNSKSLIDRHLTRLLNCKFEDGIFLVAENLLQADHPLLALGELFLQKTTPHTAEGAIIVADAWQRKGIGIQLIYWLLFLAKERDITQIIGYYKINNHAVPHLLKKLGYTYQTTHYLDVISFKLYL
ncbi:MAG TPA: GNAT family N-acetyltransferase [Candidatus Deferrimicrobium sp.]|nr:GNAT family N-acetyltransferase [Candidatus Deferrimicrobium sp.]